MVLAATAASTGAAAVVQEQEARAVTDPGTSGPVAVTPVLSVRRMPTVLAEPLADRRLRSDLATWAGTALPGCASVRDVDGVEVLDRAAGAPVVPASTVKLLTATAALEALGPDHRFRTSVVGPAPVDGVVSGDVTLVGGGDPLLATSDYANRRPDRPSPFTDLGELAAEVAASGVRRIEGAVVGDDSRYDRQRYVAGWPERYLDQHVVGPLSALSVNDGFTQYPTAERWRELVPAEDPAQSAAAALTFLLALNGVEVTAPARSGPPPATGAVELAGIDSLPLQDVVGQMLTESDNSTAELLLKEVGLTAGDPSTAGGRARAASVLAEDGLDLTGVTLADGSGLSLEDRVTCRTLLEVLADDETGPILRAGLPVAGRTGTLARSYEGTPLVGRLAAKTGTLNSVSALAGWVTDGDGALSFAYVANDPDGHVDVAAAAASQAELAQILLDWPRLPDVDRLAPIDPDP